MAKTKEKEAVTDEHTKEAAFHIAVPFDSEHVNHHDVVNLVERAIRVYFPVFKFEAEEVKPWVFETD